MNVVSFLILFVILAITALIIYSQVKKMRRGQFGCNGHCGSCSGCYSSKPILKKKDDQS